MSGLTYSVSVESLEAVKGHFEGLEGKFFGLTDPISELLVNSTKERIYAEKHGPDGEHWPAWSDKYSSTRRGGHSLLVASGEMADTIWNHATEDEVRVGTNLIYGAIHQFGGSETGSNIPARPLG